MSKPHTDFNLQPSQVPFMDEVARTIVQQPDYTGIGGHGLETHGPHGPHTQTNIGLDGTTINIRKPG